MAEQTRGELSQDAAFQQTASPPLQSRENTKEEPPRELAAQAAKEVTVEQAGRRGREAPSPVRVRPKGAPIATLSKIAKRAEEPSGGPAPAGTSAAMANESAENAKRVAEQTGGSPSSWFAGPREAMAPQSAEREKAIAAERSADPLHSADAIAEAPSAVEQAMGSPEALPEEEMEQRVSKAIRNRVLVPEAVAQRATEPPARWEVERKLQLATGPQPTMRDLFAKWRDALWEALHARGAFHVLTQAATWRRVGKAVLKFLARFVPGSESKVLRRSREIKELFGYLHEEPKKPGTWSNCPK